MIFYCFWGCLSETNSFSAYFAFIFFFFHQVSLISLKLFDTLIQKNDSFIVYNLVLRNLECGKHIKPGVTCHTSPMFKCPAALANNTFASPGSFGKYSKYDLSQLSEFNSYFSKLRTNKQKKIACTNIKNHLKWGNLSKFDINLVIMFQVNFIFSERARNIHRQVKFTLKYLYRSKITKITFNIELTSLQYFTSEALFSFCCDCFCYIDWINMFKWNYYKLKACTKVAHR